MLFAPLPGLSFPRETGAVDNVVSVVATVAVVGNVASLLLVWLDEDGSGAARSEWKQLEELNLISNKHDEIKLSPLHPNTEILTHT